MPLLLPDSPDAISDKKRIENIRTDEERIMSFEQVIQIWIRLAKDSSGQQHADGFATDLSDADHAVADIKNIRYSHVLGDQRNDGLVLG